MSQSYRDSRRLTFGAAAQAYDKFRTTYPSQSLDWILPYDARDVVDVGAGTGRLTRLLMDRGLDVIAVEPDAPMRAVLMQQIPTADCRDGTGEKLPLPDSSADAVLFAQSWHWVDPDSGSAEVARVLRPGGVLGMLWNDEGVDCDWYAAATISEPSERRRAPYSRVGAPFATTQVHEHPWTEQLSKEHFIERMLTHSRYLVLADDDRDAAVSHMREVLDSHPDTAGRELIDLPHVTVSVRAISGG